jgi:hypothetical protein
MSRLIYSMNVSLDGFVETPDHRLDWTNVDDDLHTWFNDQDRVEHNGRLVSGDVGEVLDQLRHGFDGDLEVGGPRGVQRTIAQEKNA